MSKPYYLIIKEIAAVAYPKYITKKFELTPTESNQKIISIGDSWGRWENRTRYYIPAEQFQTFNKSSGSNFSNFPLSPYPAKFLAVEFQKDERPKVSLDEYPLNQYRWFTERGIRVKKDNSKPDEV